MRLLIIRWVDTCTKQFSRQEHSAESRAAHSDLQWEADCKPQEKSDTQFRTREKSLFLRSEGCEPVWSENLKDTVNRFQSECLQYRVQVDTCGWSGRTKNGVLHWHEVIEKKRRKSRGSLITTPNRYGNVQNDEQTQNINPLSMKLRKLATFLLLSNLIIATKIGISQLSEWSLQRSESGNTLLMIRDSFSG